MFPSMTPSELYAVYHFECNDSTSQTANYLTRHQPSTHLEDLDIPMETLIASLNDATIQPNSNQSQCGPDYFQLTPTHILSHIFSFNGPMSWGKMTRINRECRLIAKGLLSKIKIYDFSTFYHNRCSFKKSKKSKNPKNSRNWGHSIDSNHSNHLYHDDASKLVSYINTFPDLQRLTLRNTHFVKWTTFNSLINRRSIVNLDLSSSLNLYDDDVAFIMEHFPNLTTLDLSQCLEISDTALSHIIECEEWDNLRALYLNHIPFITTNGIGQLLKYKKCIVELEWKGSKYGNMARAFVGATHLRSVNISSASQLQRLELSLKQLNDTDSLDLNLSNCTNLTFINLDIPYLTSLNVIQCGKLTEIRISNTFQLRTLQCGHCKVLGIIAVPANTLEIVNLSGCNALDLRVLFNESNFVMASLKNGALNSLDISHVHHISMENLDEMLKVNMERVDGNGLKALSVAECKLIDKSWRDSLHKRFARPRTKKKGKKSRKWSS